jgi:hypothetical protein
LLVVLHGCETWSLGLVEELRLRVLKNAGRISGPKMDEIITEDGIGRTCCMHARDKKMKMK